MAPADPTFFISDIYLQLIDKIIILFSLILLFAFLYLLFDDSHFGGINNIQQLIKDELLKDKIKKEIKETFYDNNNEPLLKTSKKGEKIIDDTAKEIKEVAEKDLDIEKIKPSFLQKFFNRLYFSVITATTVGYGDIGGSNQIERGICMFLMVMGVIFFSVSSGTLTNIISSYEEVSNKQ